MPVFGDRATIRGPVPAFYFVSHGNCRPEAPGPYGPTRDPAAWEKLAGVVACGGLLSRLAADR